MGELRFITKKSKSYEQDLIRKYWEQEIIQFTIKPALKKLLQHAKPLGLRILELGIGETSGYHLLSHINQNPEGIDLKKQFLLSENQVSLFMGISPDYEQVERSNEKYRVEKKVRFIRHDYRNGLGIIGKAEPSFDMYFSKHGILSQLNTTQFENLLTEICEHAKSGSIIVLDVKGKYAFSSQKSWDTPTEPYCWSGEELQALIEKVSYGTGTKLKLINKVDRSILVPPKRLFLNQLFQKDVRTDLQKLKIKEDMLPTISVKSLEDSYQELLGCWNLFLDYAEHRFKEEISFKDIENWEEFPSTLQFGLMTLDRLCKDTAWIAYGDRRANILEPHIGYVLRSLEYELQKGVGIGSEMSYVLEVKK